MTKFVPHKKMPNMHRGNGCPARLMRCRKLISHWLILPLHDLAQQLADGNSALLAAIPALASAIAMRRAKAYAASSSAMHGSLFCEAVFYCFHPAKSNSRPLSTRSASRNFVSHGTFYDLQTSGLRVAARAISSCSSV